jgi:hypothetical protein
VTAFPQDTIKSVMQTDKSGKYRNMVHCAQELFRLDATFLLWSSRACVHYCVLCANDGAPFAPCREGGVQRFYRGFLMGITRGIPGAAATFATYSAVMNAIS